MVQWLSVQWLCGGMHVVLYAGCCAAIACVGYCSILALVRALFIVFPAMYWWLVRAACFVSLVMVAEQLCVPSVTLR